jgi:hypothetical protein
MTRRFDVKTATFPSVVAAKKAATAQLGYYKSMMPAPSDTKKSSANAAAAKAPSHGASKPKSK